MPDYAAFISYSHASDRPTVEAFQQVVQTLGKRWWARRAITVFRDDTHLSATPELWPTILAALEQSRALVLLATPKAAESKWVQQEVDWWLDNRGPDRIYLVVLDGTLEWDRTAGRFTEGSDACLPSLRAAFAHEPKYIDLRPYRGQSRRDLARDSEFQSRSGDIAAALHGKPKADLMGEEIRQQRQLIRIFAVLGVALVGLLGVASWQYVEAEQQRAVAVKNADEAQRQRETAKANEGRAVRSAEEAERQKTSAELARIEADKQRAAAEAASIEAERERQAAVVNAEEAERQRDAAEKNLGIAQGAVDVLVKDITQNLTNVEGMRLEALLQILQSAKLAMEKILLADPENLGFLSSQAAMLVNFHELYCARGEWALADQVINEAERIIRVQLAKNPDRVKFKRDLYVVLFRKSFVSTRFGRMKDALDQVGEALEISREIAALEQGNFQAKVDVISSLQASFEVMHSFGRTTEAREVIDEAVFLVRALLKEQPENVWLNGELATILLMLGTLDEGNGALQSARTALEEALSLQSDLIKDNPQSSHDLRQIAAILSKLAEIAFSESREEDGFLLAEESISTSRRAIFFDPGALNPRRDLGIALFWRAQYLRQSGEISKAREDLHEALKTFRALASEQAGGVDPMIDVAMTVEGLGDLEQEDGKPEAALEYYSDLLTIRRQVVEEFPDVPRAQTDLVLSLWRMAEVSDEYRSFGVEALAILRGLQTSNSLEEAQLAWIEQLEALLK